MKYYYIVFFFSMLLSSTNSLGAKKPKLTLIFVVDQFAYHYITKLRTYLQYGIKTLLDNGINYINAHHPHAKPATATGHAAFQTGSFAKDHGFIANKWMLPDGTKTTAVHDTSEQGKLLTSPENPDIGASSLYLMTDGISDQFILSATPNEEHHVYSLSFKNRAAIATAGKLGKAIWFDNTKGLFTSSREYFDTLPSWIETFNTISNTNKLTEIEWKLFYPNCKNKYNFFGIDDYRFTRPKKSIIGTIKLTDDNRDNDKYYWYVRTPEANKQLLNLAKKCITTHISKEKNDHMILWVCISGMDKIGHVFGPYSKEIIDMIYHLDKDILDITEFAQQHVGKNNLLITFTADHGVSPAPELFYEKGMKFAFRTNKKKGTSNTNNYLYKNFGIKNIIADVSMPHINLNKKVWNALNKATQENIMQHIKSYFMTVPGIKNIWTTEEIKTMPAEKYSFIDRLKKQLYDGRSGDLLFQMHPFSVMSSFPRGANHKTPYNYDTHVPFIIYQPETFEHKTIHTPVWITQFANTLSQILNTPQPSCADPEILPGLFK